MKYKITILLMLTTAFSFACDGVEKLTNGFPTPPPENTTPTKQLAKLELRPDIELQKRIETIVTEAKGKVGAAAVLLETGDSATLNAEQHFPMQSFYKLPISMAVLHEIDDEKHALDEQIGITKEDMAPANMYSPLRDKYPDGATLTVRELIEYAVSQSDNTACDVLIRLAGGTDAIQQYLTAIGMKDMKVANPEREIQENWPLQYENFATPNAAVTLLRDLHEGNGISDANRAVLLKIMTASTTGPKRLKGLLPAGTAVAHKTGTSGTQNGIAAATNDIGIITLPNGNHIAIAVFVSDSSVDEKTREAVIAKIAKAVWYKWNGDSKADVSQVRKIKCAEAQNANDKNICNAVLKPADREDTVTFDAFEVTVRAVDLIAMGEMKDRIGSSWAGTSGGGIWLLEPTKTDIKNCLKRKTPDGHRSFF